MACWALLVEGEEAVCALMPEVLTKDDWRATEAGSGDAALMSLQWELFDLLVTGVPMTWPLQMAAA